MNSSGINIYDYHGFKDTDPVWDIANAFYIKRLYDTIENVKFVIVVKPEYPTDKFSGLVETIISLELFFGKYLDKVLASITFIVQKSTCTAK